MQKIAAVLFTVLIAGILAALTAIALMLTRFPGSVPQSGAALVRLGWGGI